MRLPWTEKRTPDWIVIIWYEPMYITHPKQLRIVKYADRKRLPAGVRELVCFGPFTLREARDLRDELQESIFDTD